MSVKKLKIRIWLGNYVSFDLTSLLSYTFTLLVITWWIVKQKPCFYGIFVLQEIVEANNDATLDELRDQLQHQSGPNLWFASCVIMDNCSIHKGEAIEALIQGAGAKLIYLPPDSPDFSPIENCWSKSKSLLRSIAAVNISRFSKNHSRGIRSSISRGYSRLVYSFLLLYLTRLGNAGSPEQRDSINAVIKMTAAGN